jgi:hypothetical protein
MDAFKITIVRRNEVNTFVTLHVYYAYMTPAVGDEVELGHERFLAVRRFWHPVMYSVTVLVEPIA